MHIEINNSQATLAVDEQLLVSAAAAILQDAGVTDGALSIAVVDDHRMHELNREFLNHDYPTDVLSFPLAEREGYLEGEVIVSADTAVSNSQEYDQTPAWELLLYVIHGVLHLVGRRDKTDEDALQMRRDEQTYLRRFAPGGEPLSTGGDTHP